MNPGPQSLSPDSVDAIVLSALALVLAGSTWAACTLLSWCLTSTDAKDRQTQVRVGSALVLAKVVLVCHALNIATFLFVKSSWQALATWHIRLLPDRANTLVMLMSYYLMIAICKITWGDLRTRVREFTNTRRAVASH
jgi:hypothetical protein